jgi:3-hydroxybutyryl-CoA dehydrogenase
MSEAINVAVIGAGLMGHGIAQVFASAGHDVILTDTNESVLSEALVHIERNLEQLDQEPAPVLARIRLELSLPVSVDRADLVIEAAPEKLEIKSDLFRKIAEAGPKTAILASNTSVIPITDIGKCLDEEARSRLVGTHWWNPPHLIPLVEVVSTRFTAPAIFERTFAILEGVGKCPVRVMRDVPGFIGNRLQHAMWREALAMVEAGVCDPETIDIVVKQSFGMRLPVLGPMENADLVGLELTRDVHRILFPHLDNSQHSSELLNSLIENGRLGMRSGAGLRTWSPGEAKAVRDQLAESLIAQTKAKRREQ